MKIALFRGKSTRTKILTAITVMAIIIILILNILFTHFTRESQWYLDLTMENFYTLSETMKEYCKVLFDKKAESGKEGDVEIIFCADPDALMNNATLRPTYFMALQLRNMFDDIVVKNINASTNPEALAQYRTTSKDKIYSTDIIVAYQGRYIVSDISGFWTQNSFSYDGEYRMASILASVTAKDMPVVYFTSNHGEEYFDPENPESEMSQNYKAFYNLLRESGLDVKTINLSDPEVADVPDDCAMIVINNPKTDFVYDSDKLDSFYYRSEIEKIDRYVTLRNGTVLFNKGYDVSLPIIEDYLKEWGIAFGSGMIKDDKNSLAGVGEPGSAIVGAYDFNSIGGVYYNEYTNLSSAPKMVFTNTGYIYRTFIDSGISEPGAYNTQREFSSYIDLTSDAVAYTGAGTSEKVPLADGEKSLASVTTRVVLDETTNEKTFSYMFVSNSADFLRDSTLGNASYANYGIMLSAMRNATRTDIYASVDLGGMSLNSTSIGGKLTADSAMTNTMKEIYSNKTLEVVKINYAFTNGYRTFFTILVLVAPIASFVLGVVVFLRRKYL